MTLNEKYNDPSYIEFFDNRPIILLKDKKGGNVSYRGENKQNLMVAAYKVDEGIMKNIPGKQCDYGLYTLPSGVMRFIELKGSDCGRAIKQLIASIDHIIDESVTGITKVNARIILSKSRTPELNTSEEKQLRKLLKKRNGDLIIKSQQINERID